MEVLGACKDIVIFALRVASQKGSASDKGEEDKERMRERKIKGGEQHYAVSPLSPYHGVLISISINPQIPVLTHAHTDLTP
jgi:hypothetical protein